MSNLTIRDLVLYYLQKDYTDRASIINRLTHHIEKLYDNFIITTEKKKDMQKLLNDLINILNRTYNTILVKIGYNVTDEHTNEDDIYKVIYNESYSLPIDLDIKLRDLFNLTTNFSLENVIEIVDILKDKSQERNLLKSGTLSYFDMIDNKLKEIGQEVGLANIEDIIKIYKLKKTNSLDKFYIQKINLMKDIFVPLQIDIEIESSNVKKIDNDLLLNNIYSVSLSTDLPNPVYYNISGYLEIDCINSITRTCQVSKEFLYEKKLSLIQIIDSMQNLNKSFKTLYIKNLSVGDILSSGSNFANIVNNDYNKYIKYSNMNFKTVMNEFLQADMKTKLQILKFLLMGKTSSINVAGLLFGMTKDMKESLDNNSKPTLLSNILYKNLSFQMQIKLRKSDSMINQELENIKSLGSDDIDLKKQVVANKNMPPYVKKIALEKLEEMKSGSSEYYKQIQYVKILIDYPWIDKDNEDIFSSMKGNYDKCITFLDNLKISLDKKVYGHAKCKETIGELVAKWISNPNSLGKVIGLSGPPGVGKTLFAKTLGDAMGIPFTQINIGGVDDGSVLSGHSFTYSSAQPGLIVRKMIAAGEPRCIMFFDEVDKTGTKHGINEVTNVLIHATDYNSNDKFNDKFLQEISFPLNKVLFVFSYNDRNKIDRILLDRIEEIEVSAYSTEDKISIIKNHLLRELSYDIGVEYESFTISQEASIYLIESFTSEAGVRELKRKLEKIITKLNVDRIYNRGPFENCRRLDKTKPIDITIDLINNYLTKPNILIKKIHDKNEIGVINGLYATSIGTGGILPILIYKNYSLKEGFKLKLTGSQKRIMQESIKFAMTIAMNIINETYINTFLKSNPHGLHIHTPDGATPKDGPSAGSAFTTCIISKILNKKIKNNIAMTGEIETHGSITAIGGLEYKLRGAKRAGVKFVFVPKENESDYIKIISTNKTLIDDNFKVYLVSHITEILEYALIDDNLNGNINEQVYMKTFNCSKYLTKIN